jgi:cyclohexanone monooxygenase
MSDVPSPKPENLRLDAAIVGGGFGGLYSIYALRKLGLNVMAFEAGSGVGGTWFWNRYPGARCALESLDYSYGFSDELQQEWDWSERYGSQPEILRYINHVADRFDLRRSVQLDTRIASATFDDPANEWVIRSTRGQEIRATYFIVAAGSLSTPRVPDFPGLETFKGRWLHSGLWPDEEVDFSGQRVGVIGTGSSGIQMIPIIAEQAKTLTVFQRTANFSLPARNAPADPEQVSRRKQNYRQYREASRRTHAGIVVEPKATQSALDVSAANRRANYESLWRKGGSIAFLGAYTDLMSNLESNETAASFVRDKIRNTVCEPATAELLTPKDHPIGSKRLCLDTGYFETYNRENVSLVDVRTHPIVEITPAGVTTTNANYELDTLVFATGFDAMTGALREIDVRGLEGIELKDHWQGGPLTYLGLMVSGFPNMFLVAGPGSPAVKVQFVVAIEHCVDLIARAVDHLKTHGLNRMNATAEAELNWVRHVNEVADGTLFPLANSWYMGANIPGKPRVFMPYVGGFERYIAMCNEVANANFRGFELTAA